MRVVHVSRFLTSIAIPLVAFALIVTLQVMLGYEFAMFPLYVFPVVKLTWDFGWKGGVVAVVIASGCWLTASLYSSQPYTYEWVRFYNAGVRGAVFAMAAGFILIFRGIVEQHRRRMETMRALINICHGCGSVQTHAGDWRPFEDLLRNPVRLSCECPKCAAVAKAHGHKPAV
jgi:hypothetical protein